ncbi:MAG TPA: hypothetical protein VNV17_07415 [Solirubrobacteraceae bacterium]|nr:hypothetical protein [Solirubrobacteraceae bacterium]
MAGRWFGVRGRRFVRPTLTLVHKGAAVRALADLEHKPWAAEDGEVWTAVFSVDKGLDGAREIELSVAPDIVVGLRPKGKKLARPGDSLSAGTAARAPRFKNESVVSAPTAPERPSEPDAEPDPQPRRRRSHPSIELERLGARLASANHELEQERERRAAMAKSLEDERTASRQLRIELGQARSELEVAATARAEATAVEAELEEARRQLREAQRRHQADTEALTRRHDETAQTLAHDHEQVTEAHAALQDELHEQAGALESTREALAAERAEAGRLRNRLAQLQQSREPGRPAAAAAGAAAGAGAAAAVGDEPRARRRTSSRSAGSSRETASREADPTETRRRQADPTQTQRFDVLGLQDETEPSPPPSRPAPRRASHQTADPPAWNPSTAERLRPLNPSLRHRTWWLGRLVALLVLCGVIAAVWAVLHSTVLH